MNFGRLLNIFHTERSWHAYWFSLVGMICPLMQEHFLFGLFRNVKFSRIVIYWAKSRRSGLEWGDLLILFNRNNCSLSVGVFSFSPMWESIAVQFLTFVPHGEQTLVEKDYPSWRTTKSSFFSRSANFSNVSPFLVGSKNTFSRPYPSTHKIAGLWKWSNDRRSERNLCNCVKKAEKKKKSGLQRGLNPWPRDTGAMLYQLSYGATDAGSR